MRCHSLAAAQWRAALAQPWSFETEVVARGCEAVRRGENLRAMQRGASGDEQGWVIRPHSRRSASCRVLLGLNRPHVRGQPPRQAARQTRKTLGSRISGYVPACDRGLEAGEGPDGRITNPWHGLPRCAGCLSHRCSIDGIDVLRDCETAYGRRARQAGSQLRPARTAQPPRRIHPRPKSLQAARPRKSQVGC